MVDRLKAPLAGSGYGLAKLNGALGKDGNLKGMQNYSSLIVKLTMDPLINVLHHLAS